MAMIIVLVAVFVLLLAMAVISNRGRVNLRLMYRLAVLCAVYALLFLSSCFLRLKRHRSDVNYGPPEYFGEDREKDVNYIDPDSLKNKPETDVDYGPPEYFGSDVDIESTIVYGPPAPRPAEPDTLQPPKVDKK